jgi:mannitol-1-phosphate 5-dehydrogenase
LLTNQISPHLRAYLLDCVGFPNCMLSRAAIASGNGHSLEVLTEEYDEWTVDKFECRGAALSFPGLEIVNNQLGRFERKLFIYDGGHTICGFLGRLHGCRYIHEAAALPEIRETVLGAMNESARVLQRRHRFDLKDLERYVAQSESRLHAAELQDEVSRAIRAPLRKLSRGDRLVGPADGLVSMGLDPVHLARGIAAGFCAPIKDDPQGVQIADHIKRIGIGHAITRICRVTSDDRLHQLISHEYERLVAQPHAAHK